MIIAVRNDQRSFCLKLLLGKEQTHTNLPIAIDGHALKLTLTITANERYRD